MSTTETTRRERAGERGYVLATTALLFVPLLVFAAFAVDVGAWYQQANRTQRAADAAALAAVVWMPNEAAATQAALDVAFLNGFDSNDPDTTITVERTQDQQVRVIINAPGEVFFADVVGTTVDIERYATAEYILPVPMGNPTNVLGGGTDVVDGVSPNYWLRAMNDCENRSTGDAIGSAGDCNDGVIDFDYVNNPQHQPAGHMFIVDVPAAAAYDLQVRLTCFEDGGSQANASMNFKLYDRDGTEFDDFDNLANPPVTDVTVDRPDTTTCQSNGADWTRAVDPAPWVTIASTTAAGRYVLMADNAGVPDAGEPLGYREAGGLRSLYSIRMVPNGTTGNWNCSRIGSSAEPGCPTIWGREHVTTYTHTDMLPTSTGGNVTRLYMAEIASTHAGKTMNIELFDPADGIDYMRILDPSGNYASFGWYSNDCQKYNHLCGRGDYGSPTNLQYQTCGGESCLQQNATYSFQDRTALIEIDLPANYDCQQIAGQPENCWWLVEYFDNGSAAETTTWSVTLSGDPVRLAE